MIVTLEAGEAWSTVVGAEGLLVRVAGGEVWLTREGDPDDHVVAAPQAFRSARRGRLAVQALTPARLEVSPLRVAASPEAQSIPVAPR